MKRFFIISLAFLLQSALLFASPKVNCEVSVATGVDGTIQISGLTGENINVKVFDEAWNLLWECNDWGTACQSTEMTGGFDPGHYNVSVESSLCQFYELVEILSSVDYEDCGFQSEYQVFDHYVTLSSAEENDGNFTLSYYEDNLYELGDSLLNLTFDLEGNLQNYNSELIPPPIYPPIQEYGHEFFPDGGLALKKFDEEGNEIWNTEVSLDSSGMSRSIIDHFVDDGIVYFIGTIMIQYTPAGLELRLFILTLDESGNFIEQKYASEIFTTSYSPSVLKIIKEHDVILLTRGGNQSKYRIAFNYDAELLYNTYWYYVQNWEEGRWFNHDCSIMYNARRFEISGIIDGFNTLTGEAIQLDLADGTGLFKYSMIPTADNGMIFSYENTSSTYGPLDAAAYGKLDSEGNIVWSHDSFPGFPAIILEDGSIVFSDYYYHDEFLTLTKTNSIGELIYCDCAVEVNVREGRIDIEKLQGDEVILNVMDEDENVVWTCNHWSGEGCAESFSIELPEGNYSIAIESEKCAIYEDFGIMNTIIEEACATNYPYHFFYKNTQIDSLGIHDIVLTNDGLQLLVEDENQNCLNLSIDHEGNQIGTAALACPEILVNGWVQSVDPIGTTSTISISKMENGETTLELEYQFPQGTFIQSYAANAYENGQGNYVFNGLIFSNNPDVTPPNTEFIPYFLTIDQNGNEIELIYGDPFQKYNLSLYSDEDFIIDETNEIYIFTASNNSGAILCGYDFEGNKLWQESKFSKRDLFIKHGRVMIRRLDYDLYEFVNINDGEAIYYSYLGLAIADRYFPEYTSAFETITTSIMVAYPGLNGNVVMGMTNPPYNTVSFEYDYFLEVNSDDEVLWIRAFEPDFRLRSTLENGDHIFIRENEDSFDLIRLNSAGEVVGCETAAAPTECQITLTSEEGQININGLVGNDLNVNVFNDAFELVWSCNFWANNCAAVEAIENLPGGNYYVAVQSDLCDFYEMVTVPVARNIDFRSTLPQSKLAITVLYPNPVDDQLSLELYVKEKGEVVMQINDSQGKQMDFRKHQLTAGNNLLNINTSKLEAGLYYLTLIHENGMTTAKKFVKY